ncbi:DUF4876 domain-containing protein [Pedobacter gandavensis]|uniref:DUF4876 domain-containing protein n=1 Tax=Pedobacter gandavensis TaxID=2679963 RepID=UPI00292DAC20|nr:DUF4876 domain-containing protein [Pedobacter gandavensis]
MKKLLLSLCLVASLLACKKDKTPGIQPTDLDIKLAFDISSAYTLPLEKITVKITNTQTLASQELITDASGTVAFKSVSAGTYDIDAVLTMSAEEYSRITGIPTENPVTFNASEKGKQINATLTGTLELKLIVGTPGEWLIKQIYYAGSNTTNGAVFRDQFLEFHNNTDRVLYADSLYFAQIIGRVSSPSPNMNYTSTGQMDWSKSPNMDQSINANKDYVYAKTLYMIPGNGKQYPVQPGKSILVAQTALNHKAPFTGNDGKVVTVRDPELTIDLSGADFEVYLGDVIGKPFSSDINNPQVPNVEVLAYSGNDMILDANGKDSYVIFKADGTQRVREWPQYNEPSKIAPSPTAKKYYQIPVKYLIDGVEIQPNIPDSRFPKKLGPTIDAGFTFNPKGNYSSQSVIRKTAKTVNGRIVLKDTNNSTEDFEYLDKANPRGFK